MLPFGAHGARGLWRGGQRVVALLLALVLIVSVGAACTLSGGTAASGSAATGTATAGSATSTSKPLVLASDASSATKTTTSDAPSQADFTNSVIQVAKTAKPAVVEITNEQTSVSQLSQPIPVGTGSGFIYDNQGHILTNNHVVEGAQSLVVTLPDGRSFKDNDVKVVGTDPLTDLAVLQITGDNLPAVQLGDSSQLEVGQWVVALGYALGLEGEPTVTAGVVSALNRSVQEPGDSSGSPFSRQTQSGPTLSDVIQTDAAINPGNSGGPLTNLDGQVIGINTLVAGEAEPGVQAEGIGFAIAINTAKQIADEIVSTGKASHPYVGVSYIPLTPAIAAQLNVTATKGALIQSVVDGSPAAKAGLQKDDIVTKVDGKELTTDSSFANAVESHKVGDTITLTVVRNGQTMQVPVTLAERPADS
ncbi:MAG TPA: trypsin-like peptidase domain-containing protein [Thermomicrobiaceae bacterium]|nr:trypsin-like peptidase domain-containing protein [Thermomicrobiaceae bacterium]